MAEAEGSIGTVSAVFVADTTKASSAVAAFGDELTSTAIKAQQAAEKVAATGNVVDRVAALREREAEKQRRAWERAFEQEQKNLPPLREIIRLQAEQAQGSALAALRADIESRSMEKAARAHQFYAESIKMGREALGFLVPIGAGVGAVEAAEGIKRMVESTMQAAVEIGHLSQQTGISVQDLSALKFAARETGVDFDVLTRAFKRLAVTTYEAEGGNKMAAKGFEQVGISVEQLRGKGDDMYGVLSLLSNKFSQLPEGIATSDAAAKIFGARMGSEMIPLLKQLGSNLDELKAQAAAMGLVWDDAAIKKMEDMHRSVERMSASFQGLAIVLASALAPAVTKATDWFGGNFYAGLQAVSDAAHDTYIWMQKIGMLEAGNFGGIQQLDTDDAKSRYAQWKGRRDAQQQEGMRADFWKYLEGGKKSERDPAAGASTAAVAKAAAGLQIPGAADAIARQLLEMKEANAAQLPKDMASIEAQSAAQLSLVLDLIQRAVGSAPGVVQGAPFSELHPEIVGRKELPESLRNLQATVDDLADSFQNTGRAMGEVFVRGLENFNYTLMQVLSTPKSFMTGQHPWRNLGADVAQTAGNATLRSGEGELLKVLGFGRKADGSRNNPLWVQIAGTEGAAGTMTSGGGIGGLLGKAAGWLGGLFGGGGGLSASAISGVPGGIDMSGFAGAVGDTFSALPHFAAGGMIPSNMPALVGENGPEILAGAGGRSVIPNKALNFGGQGDMHFHIDNRGAGDPAAVEAATQRAIVRFLPQFRQITRSDEADRRKRLPPSKAR